MTQRYRLFIDNAWKEPAGGEWFRMLDPFSGKPWAEIPRAGPTDVERAVAAAKRAGESPWSALSASELGGMLYRIGSVDLCATETRRDLLRSVRRSFSR